MVATPKTSKAAKTGKAAKPNTPRVADMTVDDLRTLIRKEVTEIVQDAIWELQQMLPDPDEGLELRPEVEEELRQALKEKKRGKPLEQVIRELGLRDD